SGAATVVSESAAAYARSDLPFFLIEAIYEGEHSVSQATVRAQAYGTLLAGAMGQVFGNGPMWCFGPADCFNWTGPPAGKAQLDRAGTKGLATLAALFASVPWSAFAPAQDVIAGGAADAVAGRTADGSVAMIYLPTGGALMLDLSKMSGTTRATWADPRGGAQTSAGGPCTALGPPSATPP